MTDQEKDLKAAVEAVVDDATARRLLAEAAQSDTYEMRAKLDTVNSAQVTIRRDQIGLRHDIAAVRRDMAEGFSTMHMRFAVMHREMAKIIGILEKLEQAEKAA